VPATLRKDNPMNNDLAKLSELRNCWVEAELGQQER
jgi:hypothetical protein